MSERSTPPVDRPSHDGDGVPDGIRSDTWAHEVTHAEAEATRTPSIVNRIVAASLRQRLLVVLGAVALVGLGLWSFRRLPVDAYPDLSPPMVEVITQWPGHAAEEVERLITAPVELQMNGLPGLRVMRSISLYGLSDVTLTFVDGTDNYFARQTVFERVPDVELPPGVSAGVSPLSSPSGLVNVILSPTLFPFWKGVVAQMCLSKPTEPPWSEFGGLLIARSSYTWPSRTNLPLAMRLPYRPMRAPKYGEFPVVT